MDKVEKNSKENAVVILNVISKLVQDIEKKVSQINIKIKECEELKKLKEKCCDHSAVVSLSAFHGVKYLVEKRILIGSQAISMLVSLLPSVNHYGALVSTIGSILLIDFHQWSEKKEYECPYSMRFQHPFIIVLKYNWEKSWFDVYHFVLHLMQKKEDIKLEQKVEFVRPIYRYLFWSSSWRGSPFQLKLFDLLLLKLHEKVIIDFALEVFLWQELDIHYCLLLQEFFIYLLKENHDQVEIVISGMTPALALATSWLITNGYNPSLSLKILGEVVGIDFANASAVLFLLTDVMMETPSVYINALIDVCKSIIFSSFCSKYVAYKFLGVILNWFVSPSFLANPIYKTLEEILDFITEGANKWNDQTLKLNNNKYYRVFGSSKKEVKFTVNLILACESLKGGKTSITDWLKNLADSKEYQMQFKIYSFIHGILLCENNSTVIHLCLDILFELIDRYKEISFSLLCLLFYKLSRETDPNMQILYLHSLPKLSVKKENISLIIAIMESLKRGSPKIMTPLIIQLYLQLWKFDNRTYSYLHKMLHDNNSCDFAWELNVSKAVALKEICRMAPHLHAKDLVGVLSKILNECSGTVSGLPSAIAIEAVTELCKAYVIDVTGTWNAIQPKLRVDKRPKVVISLCKFFGEIPNLNSSEQKNEELMKDIIPMLWNYTFFKNSEVVKNAFCALSNFSIENLPLKLFPEIYRTDIKLPKDFDKNSKNPGDILNLSYVPAEFWIRFLSKISQDVLQEGGQLVIVLMERELASLPRGIFYNPPEKSEPLSYSYLPSRSICRCLVECLQQHLRENFTNGLEYVKEMIHILSYEYSKLLPPLNWEFLKNFMSLDSEFLLHCLALLAKQGSGSSSAKSILENYFKAAVWDSRKLTEVLFIYKLLPLLCKSMSYNNLQNFLEKTVDLCLQTSISENSCHFEKVLQNFIETLRNKSVQSAHKNLIVRQLERILILIPPEHEVMKKYAICATEFPVQSIEEITSIEELNEIDSDWLRRAVTIRCAIAMRSDIKNPLVWLNEFTEAVAHFPKTNIVALLVDIIYCDRIYIHYSTTSGWIIKSLHFTESPIFKETCYTSAILKKREQYFVLNKLCFIIRNRRTCNHSIWMQELIWRIQASITSTNSGEFHEVTLFLIDVFITSAIVLSGCDCLFSSVDEFLADEGKKLEILPQALCVLLSLPDWNDMLPKVKLWLQKLSKWKHLPQDRVKSFVQALLTLGEVKSFRNENEFVCLFDLFALPSL